MKNLISLSFLNRGHTINVSLRIAFLSQSCCFPFHIILAIFYLFLTYATNHLSFIWIFKVCLNWTVLCQIHLPMTSLNSNAFLIMFYWDGFCVVRRETLKLVMFFFYWVVSVFVSSSICFIKMSMTMLGIYV